MCYTEVGQKKFDKIKIEAQTNWSNYGSQTDCEGEKEPQKTAMLLIFVENPLGMYKFHFQTNTQFY